MHEDVRGVVPLGCEGQVGYVLGLVLKEGFCGGGGEHLDDKYLHEVPVEHHHEGEHLNHQEDHDQHHGDQVVVLLLALQTQQDPREEVAFLHARETP